MKPVLTSFVLLFVIVTGIFSCSKGNDNYSVTDHTVGMVKIRTWSGNAYGKAHGDTLRGTDHFGWPRVYNRTITDTSFSVLAINGFTINVDGVVLRYRTTDSVNKLVRFDSTYSGSTTSFLAWNYGTDVMDFEYHKIGTHNDTAATYYEDNKILHSTH